VGTIKNIQSITTFVNTL